ncbi:IgGFc-binding protein-like isoform X1 [Chiroxiphia lanceolata]|uniref:IgGFc-binding protein-like isoform X1 n=1 Tax=Chiroxiphia lanceolata TaxID=296741 RepID=UPI0013CE6107|nr:IgGFc-binding protein-like isoform X1 [Chiroxiphia lanceolata]
MDLGPDAVSIGSWEFGSSGTAMALRGTWWLLLSFCALSNCSSGGREFLVVFPQNDDESPSATLKLLLTRQGPSDTAASVTLHGPFGTREVTVPPGVTKAVPIPAHLELTGSRMANKTVVVRASADVAVVAMSAKGYTVGATALLPMPSLGTRYFVVTPMGSDNYGMAELVVVAGAAITASPSPPRPHSSMPGTPTCRARCCASSCSPTTACSCRAAGLHRHRCGGQHTCGCAQRPHLHQGGRGL